MHSSKTPHQTAKQFAVWFVVPSMVASCHMFIRKGPEEGFFGLLANLVVFPSIGYVIGYVYRLIFSSRQENAPKPIESVSIRSNTPDAPTAPIQSTAQIERVVDARPTKSHAMQELPMPAGEDQWAAAMSEIESDQRRPGVWAKAFAESDGDETKTKVAYRRASR